MVFQNHLVLFRRWIDLAHTVRDEFDVDGLERTRCHLLSASLRLFFKAVDTAAAAKKLESLTPKYRKVTFKEAWSFGGTFLCGIMNE